MGSRTAAGSARKTAGPSHRVHECVFAVLSLENEAVDPRL
ncbi:MAG: hypothetical protein LBQ38_08150 [Spirochaetaceae bacterium]|nr:hypothetical protein [Spirochaetaceae bacterium]